MQMEQQAVETDQIAPLGGACTVCPNGATLEYVRHLQPYPLTLRIY